jgi:hypothetical protein
MPEYRIEYRIKVTTSENGKSGRIFYLDNEGEEMVVFRAKAPTLKALSRELRKSGFVPTNVAIKKKGVTIFQV